MSNNAEGQIKGCQYVELMVKNYTPKFAVSIEIRKWH